jgi:xanthine dehydrogenase accessory factor
MERVLRAAVELGRSGGRGVLCTIVAARGSVPAPVGSRMLVRADGTFAGTVGGGCLEHDVWGAARRVLDDGRTRRLTIDLTEYEVLEQGLACGGSVELACQLLDEHRAGAIAEALKRVAGGKPVTLRCEVEDGGAGAVDWAESDSLECALSDGWFTQPLQAPEVVILGGGHVGRAIDAAARACGWRAVVVDDRADFANAERFPESRAVVTPFAEAFAGIAVGLHTSILVVTRGHKFDAVALKAALAHDAGYVGLIGSARKILTVFQQLHGAGVSADKLATVFAPIGVAIGAVTPEEIAASVVAELVAVRRLGPEGALERNPKAAEVRRRFLTALAKAEANA